MEPEEILADLMCEIVREAYKPVIIKVFKSGYEIGAAEMREKLANLPIHPEHRRLIDSGYQEGDEYNKGWGHGYEGAWQDYQAAIAKATQPQPLPADRVPAGT